MPIDDRTTNRSYQLPNVGNQLIEDVARLRAALQAIDADVFARYTKTEVDTLINDLIQGAPGALDTLNELAAAMGDDPNFAATVTNALALKANIADVYSKAEADARFVQGAVQTEMVFIATANQSVFNLTTVVINKPSALVTVDGVVQPTSEYTLNMTGTQLTLSEGVPAGTIVRVLALGVSSEGAPADDSVTTPKLRDGAVTTEKLAPGIAPQVSGLNGGPLAGMRNLLINGNPTINQRGYVSGTATSGANQYTLDRWRVVTSGQSITWTDSNNVRTVTAPAGGVEQVIEGLNILSGTYTLSWTGTATATVDGNSVANGGQVTLTGGTNATVRFSSGTFSLAQLEVGTVVTPFERRSIGQELMLCRRYYQQVDAEYRFDGILTAGGGNISYGQTWFLNPEMRTTPTVTTVAESGQNSGSISWTPKSSTGALGTWEWQDTSSTVIRTKAAIVAASAEL